MNVDFKIFPLGDSAATLDFGAAVDEELNRKAIALHNCLLCHPFEGLKDVVMGFSSVTVFYDVIVIKKNQLSLPDVFEFVKKILERACLDSTINMEPDRAIIRIPVCYHEDYGKDLQFVSDQNNVSISEIIELHTTRLYRVYMIGFLPGFPYMGQVDEKIAVPRKPTPLDVEAGSVGIAGRQTGIYPLSSPGGWQIIGKSPLKFFESAAQVPVKFNVGDSVQFYTISKEEMLKGEW